MTADIVRTLSGPGFRVITRGLNALEQYPHRLLLKQMPQPMPSSGSLQLCTKLLPYIYKLRQMPRGRPIDRNRAE